MLQVTSTHESSWTAADLVDRFGPIPLWRICNKPLPGSGLEQHVLELHSQHKRLFELVEGTLVEKVMGYEESLVAITIAYWLKDFALKHNAGFVAGEAGMLRLAPELIRIPDVSFVCKQNMPDRHSQSPGFLQQAPDLAVEVISPGNTKQEMETKLHDYFAHGTRLVWYVYPQTREVHVFTSPASCMVLRNEEVLTGGEVLPGFELSLKAVFADLDTRE